VVITAIYMGHDCSCSEIEGQGQRSRSTRSVGSRSCIEDSFLVMILKCYLRLEFSVLCQIVANRCKWCMCIVEYN